MTSLVYPVLLGLGANLGDPVGQLARAVGSIARVMHVGGVSSVWRTEPVGHRDQPDFHNLVVAGRSDLDPRALLDAILAIEAEMGRARSFANAPRVIDIDLLAYGDRVMETPSLTLPHPRLHLRGFVLYPLAEVAPEWRHPVLGGTARELLSAATAVERAEPVGTLDIRGARLAPGRPPG